MSETKERKVTNKRTVSFSKDFAYLADQLSELPNPNRFICEAIAEKFERQNQTESPLPPAEEMAHLLKWAQQLTAVMNGIGGVPVGMGTMPFQPMGMAPYGVPAMTQPGMAPTGMNPTMNMNTNMYPSAVQTAPETSVAPKENPTVPTPPPTPNAPKEPTPTRPTEKVKEKVVSTVTTENVETEDGEIKVKPPSSLKNKRNSLKNMDI